VRNMVEKLHRSLDTGMLMAFNAPMGPGALEQHVPASALVRFETDNSSGEGGHGLCRMSPASLVSAC
jgi:hypothetical protein